ncbi:MAG TPA: lysylphosphatidylglycerol synthase transmembrane domain-containing protein [Anaerolineae bacterium]|nr:lysylphosphatidylglycerol synthase transmembrane domain-containing protein [Anaerolineae bacterium]
MIVRTKRSIVFTTGMGLLVSAAGIGLVVQDIDPARLGLALRDADPAWMLVGLLVIGLSFVARMRRWAVLLQPHRYRGTTVMAALLVGQVLNFLLPLRAGDVIRSAALGRAPGSSFERVLGSVAVEKVWDWLTLTLLVLSIALIVPLPDWFVGPAWAFGVIAVMLVLGLGLVLLQRRRGLAVVERLTGWLPSKWQVSLLERTIRLLDGMESLRRRDAMWRAASWSMLIWLLGIALNMVIMRAFGIDSWPAAMALMAVLMVGVALPPSIAALGIFEALTVLTLGVFGVPSETALAIGVTLHVIIFVPPIITGSLLTVWESRAGRWPVLSVVHSTRSDSA